MLIFCIPFKEWYGWFGRSWLCRGTYFSVKRRHLYSPNFSYGMVTVFWTLLFGKSKYRYFFIFQNTPVTRYKTTKNWLGTIMDEKKAGTAKRESIARLFVNFRQWDSIIEVFNEEVLYATEKGSS